MSVGAKLTKVMKAVGSLDPDKRVPADAGGYPYLSEDHVTRALQPHFATCGLIIYAANAEILAEREVPIGSKSTYYVRIRMTYCILDCDEPDGFSLKIVTLGEGSDTLDKALSKAQTAAYKSALLQALMDQHQRH